eukprot:SAG22_NODE_100_length_20558_cov_10.189305_9_plen_576_part_00
MLLAAAPLALALGSPPPQHMSGVWRAPPAATPSKGCPDGPVLGNGAVSVALSGTGNGSLVFLLTRNDAWVPATGDISACGYEIETAGARTLGRLALEFDGAAGFRATQQIENGTVVTAQPTAHGGTLRSSSFVARGSDVIVTEVWWDVPADAAASAGPAPPPLALQVLNAQSGAGSTCVLQEQNAAAMWSSRTLGHPYQNVNSTVGRRHLYKATWATAVSSPPLPPPAPPSPPGPPAGPPPPAPCSTFDGDCAACISAHDNRKVWPGACLQLNTSIVNDQQSHSCVPSSWWREYNETYRGAHSCTSCTADKNCKSIPDVPASKVGSYQLTPGRQHKLTIATAVLSNWDPTHLPRGAAALTDTSLYPDPTAPAQQLALQASKTAAELRSSTTAWWEAFWSKSSVSLPRSPSMEQQWFGSLYILASSHRTDGSPFAVAPGIVWPVTNDAPAFRGAMTMNYNQEALYYGIYSANHADLAGPYYNAMNQYIPRGRKDAQSFFQCPGINVDCEIFHWGQSTSGVGDQGQRSNAALAAVPYANHWLWTRDVDWLRDVGWQYVGSHDVNIVVYSVVVACEAT